MTRLSKLVLFLSASVALSTVPLHAVQADAYDDKVQSTGQVKASFGHDVDAEGKMADFVKAGLGSFAIPHGGAEQLKKIMINGYDYWKAERANQQAGNDPTLSGFNRFFIKSMLDTVSPKELVRVKRMLGDNAAAAKILKEAGVDVSEAVAGALPDGSARDVIEAAAIAAIDALCPKCAVARTAAVVAITEGKKLRAVFEDDRTRALYEAWKQGDGQLPQGLRGGDAVYVSARRAVEEARAAVGQTGEIDDKALDDIILAKFRSWQRGEAVAKVRAATLAAAKPQFEALDPLQKRLFGATEKEQAEGFASGFLDAHDHLKTIMGNRPVPPSLIRDAVFIAVSKADPHVSTADWRNRLREVARTNGWPDPFPADPTGTHQRVSQRLKKLNHFKMQAVFDAIGVPDSVRTDLYKCLCAQVPHGSGVSYVYDPKNGKPCSMVGGFGVDFVAFPKVETAYDICFDSTRVPLATGGQALPFDEYLAGRLTGKR